MGGKGQLTILGLGYRVGAQATVAAEQALRRATRVFHLVNDRMMVRWLESLNESCVTLMDCYVDGRPSDESIEPMTQRVLDAVRAGERVCVAFPGHPGYVVPPTERLPGRLGVSPWLPCVCLLGDPIRLKWICSEKVDTRLSDSRCQLLRPEVLPVLRPVRHSSQSDVGSHDPAFQAGGPEVVMSCGRDVVTSRHFPFTRSPFRC